MRPIGPSKIFFNLGMSNSTKGLDKSKDSTKAVLFIQITALDSFISGVIGTSQETSFKCLCFLRSFSVLIILKEN